MRTQRARCSSGRRSQTSSRRSSRASSLEHQRHQRAACRPLSQSTTARKQSRSSGRRCGRWSRQSATASRVRSSLGSSRRRSRRCPNPQRPPRRPQGCEAGARRRQAAAACHRPFGSYTSGEPAGALAAAPDIIDIDVMGTAADRCQRSSIPIVENGSIRNVKIRHLRVGSAGQCNRAPSGNDHPSDLSSLPLVGLCRRNGFCAQPCLSRHDTSHAHRSASGQPVAPAADPAPAAGVD